MAIYHPPKIITNNAAPSISADLMYEEHGKCGQTRVLATSAETENAWIFDAEAEDSPNAWKMVVINVGGTGTDSRCDCRRAGVIKDFRADNMTVDDCEKLCSVQLSGDSIPFEVMADINYVELDTHYLDMIVILYMDCEQS